MRASREVQVERVTRETRIVVSLSVDGARRIDVATQLGFLDHMLVTLAFHAGWDLELRAEGDWKVDDHHTVEDAALVLGQAVLRALGERTGIRRFGSAWAPMDEALARAVVDLSGRPWPEVNLGLRRERIGEVATENLTHFFRSFAIASRSTLHVDVIRGENDHHRAEAAFKAMALALRLAVDRRDEGVPSTKGVIG